MQILWAIFYLLCLQILKKSIMWSIYSECIPVLLCLNIRKGTRLHLCWFIMILFWPYRIVFCILKIACYIWCKRILLLSISDTYCELKSREVLIFFRYMIRALSEEVIYQDTFYVQKCSKFHCYLKLDDTTHKKSTMPVIWIENLTYQIWIIET